MQKYITILKNMVMVLKLLPYGLKMLLKPGKKPQKEVQNRI